VAGKNGSSKLEVHFCDYSRNVTGMSGAFHGVHGTARTGDALSYVLPMAQRLAIIVVMCKKLNLQIVFVKNASVNVDT
jgi:hypothetical protein